MVGGSPNFYIVCECELGVCFGIDIGNHIVSIVVFDDVGEVKEMRRMWGIVQENDDSELMVVEVEGGSRKEIEYTLENHYKIVKWIMTENQILRFRNLSIYEFAKKYGKKGWTLELYYKMQRVKI